MEVVVDRCAGLDVSKDEVVVCVRMPDEHGGRRKQVRTFLTFTDDLEELAGWLESEQVTKVVMEATGQFWKPVVRREALCTGWGESPHPAIRRSGWSEAEGSPGREMPAKGGSSPDNVAEAQNRQMRRSRKQDGKG